MIAISPFNRPLTADDIADLPDDGMRYELIGGELHMSPAPGVPHQVVSSNLSRMLSEHLVPQGLGMVLTAPLDIRFDDVNVVQPDLIVVASENLSALEGARFSGIPDLLIEILSSQSSSRDFIKKSLLYSVNLVPEYWIVDADHDQIHVYTLDGGRYAEQESADGVARPRRFPGLEVDPRGLSSLPTALQAKHNTGP